MTIARAAKAGTVGDARRRYDRDRNLKLSTPTEIDSGPWWQLTWSVGARGLFGLDEELPGDQLAEAETRDVKQLVAVIPSEI
jgi:hypothetical protein